MSLVSIKSFTGYKLGLKDRGKMYPMMQENVFQRESFPYKNLAHSN